MRWGVEQRLEFIEFRLFWEGSINRADFELLPRHPIVSVASAMKLVEASKPTAIRAIGILEAADILAETTGRRRDRSFSYQAYLDLLRVGTDLEGRR